MEIQSEKVSDSMIYEEPRFRTAGDSMISIEFGDEALIELSFRVLALDAALKESQITGVTETIPTIRSLGILFDILRISRQDLVREIRRLEIQSRGTNSLLSRLLEIPVWYDDPWSQECAKAHGVLNNMHFVAEHCNLSERDVIAIHSGTDHWVAQVGFTPGCFGAWRLDQDNRLSAPKYDVPRTWTPPRTLAIAGTCTTVYPIESPGGYQMIGRSPIDFFKPKEHNDVFGENLVLTRAGDRHRYMPISGEKYEEIRNDVKRNRYQYQISEDLFTIDIDRPI